MIEHCSPTLASIKTGNLFTYKYESEEELWKSVEGFNECVREKGVSLTVERLRIRLAQREDFPHEIGLFLGYPLGDVIGFIKNAGQNCKCVGCWKVYCNECEAIKAFARFKKCTSVYVRLWNQGRSVRQLTVAA